MQVTISSKNKYTGVLVVAHERENKNRIANCSALHLNIVLYEPNGLSVSCTNKTFTRRRYNLKVALRTPARLSKLQDYIRALLFL